MSSTKLTQLEMERPKMHTDMFSTILNELEKKGGMVITLDQFKFLTRQESQYIKATSINIRNGFKFSGRGHGPSLHELIGEKGVYIIVYKSKEEYLRNTLIEWFLDQNPNLANRSSFNCRLRNHGLESLKIDEALKLVEAREEIKNEIKASLRT